MQQGLPFFPSRGVPHDFRFRRLARQGQFDTVEALLEAQSTPSTRAWGSGIIVPAFPPPRALVS